jgi:diguanylate cyclase (GGDEF)-like protein
VDPDTPDKGSRGWFAVAVVVFLAAVAYAIYAVLDTAGLAEAPLLALGVAASIALAGWWWDRGRRAAAEEEARRERERLESGLRERENDLRESREQLEAARVREDEQRRRGEELASRLEKNEKALGRERYLRARSEEARQTAESWNQDLHAEIMRMYRERGSLGDASDVPSMVLRLARTLLEAEKGLLLWQQDENGDGRLDLAAAEGFEGDPRDSALAQRFASEVLERDRTVREENPQDDGSGGGADEEIKNLVAIPIYLQDEFSGVVVCANNPDGFDGYEDEVLLSMGDQAGAVLQNARLRGELRAAYLATVGVLAGAMEVKDPFLRGHAEVVSGYVAAVADRLGLPSGRREELLFGSLLHDVGKIGISERILLKPASLTPEERSVVELHPRIGYRLVEQVPALRPIAPAVLHHHERFDGAGYPSRLRGEEIPLEARIICVADSFSAMIEERPYREPLTVEEACRELQLGAGTQFDPEVVRIFVEEVRRRPPALGRPDLAEEVPKDPEIEVRRRGDEPILGCGPVSLTDNLTMLYTRRYLHEAARAEAQRAMVQGRPFGVVLVELAGVAELNRKSGYAAGDEAIRSAAGVVRWIAEAHDGTACRYGGHRLALIVPRADDRSVSLVADEVLRGLSDRPSARVGTAAWRPGDDGESVIVRARASLDQARESR